MPERPEDGAQQRLIGRRAFVALVVGGLSSLAWGQYPARLLSKLTLAVPQSVRGAVPLGEGWRIYAVDPPMPRFDPATWRLTVDGLVERPLSLSYAELMALPQVRQTSDFHCVTGWTVQDVGWGGVRIAELLDRARPLPHAGALEFASLERPYVDTLTIAQATLPDSLLAHRMDGQPLTRDHGAPARMVIPQMYGYKGVKWLHRITVTERVREGYWEQRGYDRDAWVGRSNGL